MEITKSGKSVNVYLSNLGGNAEERLSWEKEQAICFESADISWEVWTGGQLVERLGREQRHGWWELLQASLHVAWAEVETMVDKIGIENRRKVKGSPGAHRRW